MSKLVGVLVGAVGAHSMVLRMAAVLFSAAARADDLPPLAPPAGATAVVRDTCANFWAIGPAASDGRRALLVLPAQAPSAWSEPRIAGLEPGSWQSLAARPDRGVIVADGRRAWRFDPKTPGEGATEIALAASEAAQAAGPWRPVARMPASNHDISAAVYDGLVYVAGGTTSHWGFPATDHAFDEIWELDPATWIWRTPVRFSQPRVYCYTVTFDDRVWVIGGDVVDREGKRRPSTLVELFDPRTRQLVRGPDLPVALPRPLALAAAGRLWVVGSRDRDERGQFASIGLGETAWRVEPPALPHMWALAGAVLEDKIYVAVPNTGLAVFDPPTRRWSVIPGPTQPRSAQVAAWRGEIWLMGGCDIPEWNDVRIYNPKTRSWRAGPALPSALAWGAAAVVDDQLVVMGGAGREHPSERPTYVFSDRTFVLAASAIPPAAGAAAEKTGPRWSDARLRGTGELGLPYATVRVFPGLKFGRLASVLTVPGGRPEEPERLLVAEVDGAVWTFPNRPDVRQADPMLDLPRRFGRQTHTYALAFHPRFPAVPHAYVLYNRVQPKPAENVLARFTVTRLDPPLLDPASEQVLLRWPSDGHNGGDVRFDREGLLYVSTGDRSRPGDPENVGQRVDMIVGGVLRIDVERTEPGKNYAVPPDNPFVGRPDVRPEFWAYGLRNPWRMAFAPTGELWLGDNGDDSWESVHLVRKGHNYGWSVFEGTHPFKRNRALAGPTPRVTAPVIELPHSEARSVIGGLVYRGTQFPALRDHYVFGDYVTGFIWAFQWDGVAANGFRRIADTRSQIIAFGADQEGELLMARGDGQIHRLVAAPPAATQTKEFPRWLSETGLFASTAQHVPAPGVMPYEINAGLWSDGAQARRFLAVSGGQPIVVDSGPKNHWQLPEGSAVVRTLQLPTGMGPRRVETQVMYRERGDWRFYTYAWNEAQTDAERMAEGGETRSLPGLGRTWRFGGRGECAICHSATTSFTIGLTTGQLNRDADLSLVGRRVENQITAFAEAGLLNPPPKGPPELFPRKADPDDPTLPIEQRARAYLDVNCAHCHREGGVGGRAAFQLIEALSLERTGIVNGRPLVPLLGPDSKLLTPGRPEQSEIFHRLTLKEGGRMPLLGSEQTDAAGAELIREFIVHLAR